MEEILKLYEDCKDYKKLLHKKNKRIQRQSNYKIEIEKLQKEIENLENEIDTKNKYDKELLDLEKEIQKLKIMNKTITNIDELDEILDDEILAIKCEVYTEDLVCLWQDNEQKTIVLNKNIKPFFEKIRTRSCYKMCKTLIYNKLKSFLDDFMFTDTKFEEHKNEIYISKNEDGNIEEFIKNNREISNFIVNILMNNLKMKVKECFQNKQNDYNELIIKNNNKIKDTRFCIRDHSEFIDKLLLETINEIANKPRKSIIIDKEISDYNFSEEFSSILFCLENFTVKPENKIIQVVLLNFFDTDRIEMSLFSYLCVYGEISYILTKYKMEKIIDLKEKLCALIAKNIDMENIKFGLPHKQLKLVIGSHYYAFKEVLEFFITDSTRLIFITIYFDMLCENYFRFVIDKKNIDIEESESICEIIEYIFEICGVEKALNSYCKMKCLKCILKSNIVEIETSFVNGLLCLHNQEILLLVNALFNDSERKMCLIQKLSYINK